MAIPYLVSFSSYRHIKHILYYLYVFYMSITFCSFFCCVLVYMFSTKQSFNFLILLYPISCYTCSFQSRYILKNSSMPIWFSICYNSNRNFVYFAIIFSIFMNKFIICSNYLSVNSNNYNLLIYFYFLLLSWFSAIQSCFSVCLEVLLNLGIMFKNTR